MAGCGSAVDSLRPLRENNAIEFFVSLAHGFLLMRFKRFRVSVLLSAVCVVAGCTEAQQAGGQTELNELIDRALLCRVHPQTIVNLLSDGETARLQQLVQIRAH